MSATEAYISFFFILAQVSVDCKIHQSELSSAKGAGSVSQSKTFYYLFTYCSGRPLE